jgi:hypothetical protein
MAEELLRDENKTKKCSNLSNVQLWGALGLCVVIAVIVTTVVVLITPHDSDGNKGNYKVWCVGNCDLDVTTLSQPGTVFVGGGVCFFSRLYLTICTLE